MNILFIRKSIPKWKSTWKRPKSKIHIIHLHYTTMHKSFASLAKTFKLAPSHGKCFQFFSCAFLCLGYVLCESTHHQPCIWCTLMASHCYCWFSYFSWLTKEKRDKSNNKGTNRENLWKLRNVFLLSVIKTLPFISLVFLFLVEQKWMLVIVVGVHLGLWRNWNK